MTNEERYSRYPGPPPYDDSKIDFRRFFGRDEEKLDLLYMILGANLTVLYGKSGLGKTSLLQAGVFPLLQERNHLPMYVRLNEQDKPPLEIFFDAFKEACRKREVDYTPGERGGLWEFFKTSLFWDPKEGNALIPVMVIDQFEEIFTLQRSQNRCEITDHLVELLSSRIPDRLLESSNSGKRSAYSNQPPAVKVILSLRESHLGELQALAGQLLGRMSAHRSHS